MRSLPIIAFALSCIALPAFPSASAHICWEDNENCQPYCDAEHMHHLRVHEMVDCVTPGAGNLPPCDARRAGDVPTNSEASNVCQLS